MDAAAYAIEIAAKLQGGEATSAQLDALADQLSTSGIKAGFFEDAMIQVSRELDAARASSAAANQALADGRAQFAQLERAADKAARAAERAAARNKDGVVPPSQAAAVAAADAALKGYVGTLAQLEAEAKAADAAQARMAATASNLGRLQTRVNDRLGDAATNLSTFRGALGDIGGPIGEFGERLLFPAQAFVDLREKFGLATAAGAVFSVGLAAVAAALALVTAAAVAGVAAIAAYAFRLADTARSAGLAQEAFNKLNPTLAGVSASYSDLTRDTNLSAEQLRGLSLALKDAKVSASDMPAALRAAAIAEAALGQGGSADFVARIKAGKLAVQEFANVAERDFGGIVARQMLGLEAQGARLQRNLAETFGGLKIESALVGISRLVGLFDKSSATGRAMKMIFETLFQPLIDQVNTASYVIEAFILGMAIGAVRVYNAFKPVIKAVADLVGTDLSGFTFEEFLAGVAKAGEYLVPILLGAAAGMALIGAAIVGTTALALTPLAGLVGGVVALIGSLWQLSGVVATVMQAVQRSFGEAMAAAVGAITAFATSAYSLGASIVQGLANGITGSAGAVIQAITGVAGGAIAAAKRQLGIASPSKVFAQLGQYTGEGFVQGVEGEQASAEQAMADLTAPPSAGALNAPAGPGAGAQGVAAGGRGASFDGATFVFNGVAGADDAVDRFRAMLRSAIQGDTLALSGART